MPAKSADNTEILIPVLDSQVIPCLERFGLDRVAVTAETLKQFNAQELPELMRTSVKKRMGKAVSSRSMRIFNNTSSFPKSWPEDDQAIFRYPALVYLLQGQADFHVGDYMVHCPQNHFLLFRSGVPRPMGGSPHFDRKNTERKHCAVLWFFAPPGTNSVTAYVCHSEGDKHWIEKNTGYCALYRPELLHLYKLLIQELESRSPASSKSVLLCLQTFLHLFLNELKQGRFHRLGRSNEPSAVVDSASPIEQAQQYIKTHLGHSLTAASVAQEVHMSRNSFIRHFTREAGCTFHDFVLEQRMEEAKRLLSEGHWSVHFICRFIGLKSTQFRSQFKKYTGISPSQFRQESLRMVQNRRERDDSGDNFTPSAG